MLDIDTFGKVIDGFLSDNHVQMMIDIPEGTLDVNLTDNTNLGGVVQFYLLLNAIPAAIKNMASFWQEQEVDAEQLAAALADLVQGEIKAAIESTRQEDETHDQPNP